MGVVGPRRATRVLLVGACLLLFAMLAPAPVRAAPAAVVDPSTRHLQLAPHLEVLEDAAGTLSLDDVEGPDVAARFRPSPGSLGPNFGVTRSVFWVRFAVENATDTPLERWLVVDFAPVENVEVFRSGERPSIQGSLHPRAARELPRRGYSFRIALAAHERREVHLRVWGDTELRLPVVLWERSALEADDRTFTTWAALAYGVMLALALYNLMLFFFVRERTHLYYAADVVFAVLWLACLDDTMIVLLPASIPWTPHGLNVVTGCGWFVFVMLFARSFLRLRDTHPRIDRAVLLYTALGSGIDALYFAGVLDYRTQNAIAPPVAVLGALALVGLAVLRWREGFTPARYFVLAWTAMTCCAVPAALSMRGVLSLDASLLMQAGFGLEALVLSLALADAAKRRDDRVAALQKAGARFVPHELLALLGKHDLPEVKQGDQVEKEMTIFFLDVRSFTSLVEKMTPERAIAFVNAVFARMDAPIATHRGFIDKFMGDGIMALFESADDAVAAAVACLGALDAYNGERAERGEPALAVGIGLHTGPLMVGTVGAGERLSCTVIGDSVNLGARIEGMTKTFGASILVSEATHAALARPEAVEVRRLGRVTAKGKVRAVGLYEVLDGLPAPERARKLASRARFEAAVDAYVAYDLAAARGAFSDCANGAGAGDRAAALYLEVCARTDDRAPASWDGAVRLDVK